MPSRFRPLWIAGLGVLVAQCHDPSTAPVISALPRALTAGEQRLIDVDNQFAFTFVGQLARDTRDTMPNLFVSPLSAAMALAMAYNGAAGTTEAGMRQALGLGDMSLDELNDSYRSLIALLRRLDPRVRFEIANSAWYRQGFAVEPTFLDATRTYFDAQVEGLDFTSDEAPRRINAWVAQRTQDRITEIVPSPLPDHALLYLINAIYFKGDWTEQFDKARTRPGPFRLADGSTVQVPLMHTREPIQARVHESAAVQVADLSYGGRAFSMTIVLPRDPAALDSVLLGLTRVQWDAWVAGLDTVQRDVTLPKFRFVNDLRLNSTLAALGMSVAFSCEGLERADFTRIHAAGGICITDVKHKSFVDVNEEGTEAAAVTSVEIGVTSAPPVIHVDRPFLFAIRENLSGTILFLGVVRNPALLQ